MLEMSEIPDEKIKLSVFEWPELKKVEAIFTMWNKKKQVLCLLLLSEPNTK